MNKEIVITDIIDIITDFVKQEKQKAVSDKLTELCKEVLNSHTPCYEEDGTVSYAPDISDKQKIKQLFTEAGMK